MDYGVDSSPDEPADPARGPISGLFNSIAHLLANGDRHRADAPRAPVDGASGGGSPRRRDHVYGRPWRCSRPASACSCSRSSIIFVFWDTHRVLASVGVTSVFFLIAVVAGLMLRAKVRGKPPLLDATLAELKKDRASLLSKR